jgi:hypothetical protein
MEKENAGVKMVADPSKNVLIGVDGRISPDAPILDQQLSAEEIGIMSATEFIPQSRN